MLAQATTQRFCELVEQKLGLDLAHHSVHDLERLLTERSSAAPLDLERYVERLTRDDDTNEWLVLSDKLTVGETYFFRHMQQLAACCTLVRRHWAKLGRKRPVRVLSAGCSTGEEPYSVAMLLREHGVDAGVEVVGLDINPHALQRARAGRYSAWSLRETPPRLVERWFRRERAWFRLDQSILDAVSFIQGNLAAPGYLVVGEYDFVLCRNVLMYFSPSQFRRAATRLIGALNQDGALFLGHAESLRGMHMNVEPVHDLGTFYYVRKDKLDVSKVAARADAFERAVPHDEAARLPLTVSHADPSSGEAGETTVDLSKVDTLVGKERFLDALTLLETFPVEVQLGEGFQLRKAMLLVHTNRFEAAEGILVTLLNNEGAAAEVHYALAVCHNAASQWQEAVYHYRFSAYLDPTFALPWLQLGLLSKRLGNGRAARQELLQARALLATETPERLLWFGGGCTRSTLLETCQRGLEMGRDTK